MATYFKIKVAHSYSMEEIILTHPEFQGNVIWDNAGDVCDRYGFDRDEVRRFFGWSGYNCWIGNTMRVPSEASSDTILVQLLHYAVAKLEWTKIR